MRYKGNKGKFWKVFSQFIRMRDYYKYGTCVSCGLPLAHWKLCDAGHYIAAGHCGFGLLFDEKNVNAQCKRCNNPKWTPDASVGYKYELDRRFGEGTADSLYERFKDNQYKGKITKEFTQLEYESKINYYKEKISNIISEV